MKRLLADHVFDEVRQSPLSKLCQLAYKIALKTQVADQQATTQQEFNLTPSPWAPMIFQEVLTQDTLCWEIFFCVWL